MRMIPTKDAVGSVICHDITRIVKDGEKAVAFRKGHIVQERDIALLLDIGKEHLYVWEKRAGMLHENEAAVILAQACQNHNMYLSDVKEGKIEVFSDTDGLFTVDLDRLAQINEIENMMIATRNTMQFVKKGDKLAGTRIIPLVIEEQKMLAIKKIADTGNPILEVKPVIRKNIGVVTTGSELFYGRIKDTFTPVLEEKLNAYGAAVKMHEIVLDDRKKIRRAVLKLKDAGMDVILCTGGMSVDPDDVTPAAIKESGVDIITYGAPVLPGAMFLLGYFNDETPILGLPGCVMYARATIFDIMLPRVLAGVKLQKQDFVKLGNGGLCLNCPVCRYPDCGYGKGV